MTVRLRRLVGAVACGLLVAAVASACSGDSAGPEVGVARRYLDAFAKGDVSAAAAVTTNPTTARGALAESVRGMAPATPAFTVGGSRSAGSGDARTVSYQADWRLPGGGTWHYAASLNLVRSGAAGWQVRWSPSAVAPGLDPDETLLLTRVRAARAPLRDRAGQPLFTPQPVVTVGIDPTQVTSLPSLARTLAGVAPLQSSAQQIEQAVRAAPKGTRFVPIITLRRPVYESIRAQIHDLPGTAFQTATAMLSPRSGFATELLGKVGPATAQQIADSKGAIGAGDDVGQGGLQEVYESTLAGRPGYVVEARTAITGASRVLARPAAPVPGTPVTLTLDRTIQEAADSALAGVPLPASIVVTRPSTGQVLAVADSDSAPGDIALTGQYPPGSVFKVVSFAALFARNPALGPSSPVQCPGTYLVNGQTIHNENSFDKGSIDVGRAFAFSCNTTTADLVLHHLQPGDLARGAAAVGLGQHWSLPLDAFSGSIPPRAQSNELAAEAYGQGETLVSPLLMAEIVGAVDTGTAIAPTLVAGTSGARLPALDPRVVADMRTLLRDVVTVPGATGRTLADLPGEVGGKTGTAEYGTDVPPKAHSWFAGVRGDLAYAIFVQGGEFTQWTGVRLAHPLLEGIPLS